MRMAAEDDAIARWVCYLPESYDRGGRNYQPVSRDPAVSREVAGAFGLRAEAVLRARGGSRAPVWQYVWLGQDLPAALMLGSMETREGKAAAVVRGLLLPAGFVTSSRFALDACAREFRRWDDADWPGAVSLNSLPARNEPSPGALALAAGYMQPGTEELRVNIADSQVACSLFCQVVEMLAPADRLSTSFSTEPQGRYHLQRDPSGPDSIAPDSAREGRALLLFWDRLKEKVPLKDQAGNDVYPQVSLRVDDPGAWDWLQQLWHTPEELVETTKQLLDLVADLPVALQETIVGRGIHGYLTSPDTTPEDIEKALNELMLAQLLTRTDLIPPLQPVVIATRLGILARLWPNTLKQILTGERAGMVAQYLLTMLQNGTLALTSDDLLDALERLPGSCASERFSPDDRRAIDLQCQEASKAVRSLRGKDASSQLLTTLGSLALHYSTRDPKDFSSHVLRRIAALSKGPLAKGSLTKGSGGR
jgi:hypothetical protein